MASRSEGMQNLAKRADELATQLDTVTVDNDGERVSWLEIRGSGWIWHSTPLDVASPFARAMNTMPGAWVFTSATLSVKDSLSYFCNRLGVYEAEERILPSPFAYEDNALLYGPQGMPAPASPDFDTAVVNEIVALVNAADGGAFVLCTSYRAVRSYGQALVDAGFSPLVQGQASRASLLADFRADENAVLVATSSFWEGVDLPGGILKALVLTRLPFQVPTDPIVKARSDQFQDPFSEYSVPQAVLRFRQGMGRLIRSKEDRGAIVVLDRRITARSYGKAFLQSTPPCTLEPCSLATVGAQAARWTGDGGGAKN